MEQKPRVHAAEHVTCGCHGVGVDCKEDIESSTPPSCAEKKQAVITPPSVLIPVHHLQDIFPRSKHNSTSRPKYTTQSSDVQNMSIDQRCDEDTPCTRPPKGYRGVDYVLRSKADTHATTPPSTPRDDDNAPLMHSSLRHSNPHPTTDTQEICSKSTQGCLRRIVSKFIR